MKNIDLIKLDKLMNTINRIKLVITITSVFINLIEKLKLINDNDNAFFFFKFLYRK